MTNLGLIGAILSSNHDLTFKLLFQLSDSNGKKWQPANALFLLLAAVGPDLRLVRPFELLGITRTKDQLATANCWAAEEPQRFCRRLKATPEGSGIRVVHWRRTKGTLAVWSAWYCTLRIGGCRKGWLLPPKIFVEPSRKPSITSLYCRCRKCKGSLGADCSKPQLYTHSQNASNDLSDSWKISTRNCGA